MNSYEQISVGEMTPGLLELPPEVLDFICGFVPPKSLLQLSLVCRALAPIGLRAIYKNLTDDVDALVELASRTESALEYPSFVSSVSLGNTVLGLDFANQKLASHLDLFPRFTHLRKLHLRYVKLSDSLLTRVLDVLPSSLGAFSLENCEISGPGSQLLLQTLPTRFPNLEELRLIGLGAITGDLICQSVSRLPHLVKLHLGCLNSWSVFTPETCKRLAFDAFDHARRGSRLRSLGLYQFSNKKGVLLPFLEAHGPTLEELVIEFRTSLLGNSIIPANGDDYLSTQPNVASTSGSKTTSTKKRGASTPVVTALDTHLASLLFSHPSVFPPNLRKLSILGLLATEPKQLLAAQRKADRQSNQLGLEMPGCPSVRELSLTPMFRIRAFTTEPPHLLSLLPLFPSLDAVEIKAIGRTRRSRLPDAEIARVLATVAGPVSKVVVGERGLDFGPKSWAKVKELGAKEVAVPAAFVQGDKKMEVIKALLQNSEGLRKVTLLGADQSLVNEAELEEAETRGLRTEVVRHLVWPPNFVSNSVSLLSG